MTVDMFCPLLLQPSPLPPLNHPQIPHKHPVLLTLSALMGIKEPLSCICHLWSFAPVVHGVHNTSAAFALLVQVLWWIAKSATLIRLGWHCAYFPTQKTFGHVWQLKMWLFLWRVCTRQESTGKLVSRGIYAFAIYAFAVYYKVHRHIKTEGILV